MKQPLNRPYFWEDNTPKNPLLEDLVTHIQKNGFATGADFAMFTCIPSYIKNVLLGTVSEDELFLFDVWSVSYTTLAFQIMDTFISVNHFKTKNDWDDAIESQFQLIQKKASLFPEKMMDYFLDAYFSIRWELSLEEIMEIRKKVLQLDSEDENEIYQSLKEHLESETEIDRTVLAQVTCVPYFMKKTILGEGDGGKSVYQDRELSLDELHYVIIQEYLVHNDFETHEKWIHRLEEEILLLRKAKLFPAKILECFEYVLYDLAGTQTTGTLKNLRDLYLKISKTGEGNDDVS